MSYVYTTGLKVIVEGALTALSETPTIYAYDFLTGDALTSPAPTITSVRTGVYRLSVTADVLTDVLFIFVPHEDDEDKIGQEALMHQKMYHVVEELADGVTLADGAITAAKIASDAIEAAKIKADAVTKIQNGLATPTNITKVVGAELASTQGAITWGQQKILADVAEEGALHMENENNTGVGQYIVGGRGGQVNMGSDFGQVNAASGVSGVGQLNEGTTGQRSMGSVRNVDGYDTALAKEATLTAIKGAGFDDETLVAIMEAIEAIDPGGGGGLSKADVRDAVGLATNNLDTQLGNIKTDTGNVSTRLTATRAGYLDKLNVSGTLANTDNASTFKADVSGIPAAVWGFATRTLSSFGTLISDIWSFATRTLSAFGFTVATNSDANVTAIKAKTDNLPASPAPAGEYTSALAGLATSAEVNALNDITAADVLAEEVIGGYSLAQVLTALAAKSHGLASGGGTTTITYKGIDGTPNVVVETVDGKGNRSNVVLNV